MMVFLTHHVPTRPDLVKNREGHWCLDEWKISMILRNARDIFDKYGIDISQMHIEKYFCDYLFEWVIVNIGLEDQPRTVDSGEIYNDFKQRKQRLQHRRFY